MTDAQSTELVSRYEKVAQPALRELFDSTKPWSHQIDVLGVPTKTESAWGEPLDHPHGLWGVVRPHLPDLEGRRVLDVGCNDGFFLLECARRGAASVVGIEANRHYYGHAVQVKDLLHFDNVEVLSMSAYDIDESLGRFDVALLLGLIYHLKNPLSVIDRVASITESTMILETAIRNSALDLENRQLAREGVPGMDFLEHRFEPMSDKAKLVSTTDSDLKFEGAPNWWVPNAECVCAMLRSAGFKRTEVVQERILEPGQAPNIFGRATIVAHKR